VAMASLHAEYGRICIELGCLPVDEIIRILQLGVKHVEGAVHLRSVDGEEQPPQDASKNMELLAIRGALYSTLGENLPKESPDAMQALRSQPYPRTNLV